MRFRRWVSVLALMALAFGLGRASVGTAQAVLSDGLFVRDSGGNTWLIIGGQRARVPFRPATDDAIFSVPDSGQWVVPGDGGGLTLGAQPDFVNASPIIIGNSGANNASDDPAPSVIIQVDDDRATTGQQVTITVIAEDNHGVQWIEWE